MIQIICFIIIFILVLFYYLIIFKKQKKKNNFINMQEFSYLNKKFHLTKIDYLKLYPVIAIINAFIIATVSITIIFLDIHFIWQLFIGFALLFVLIYVLYEILGRILKSKE